MTILVLDTDPAWLAHCAAQGADTCSTLLAALAMVDSARYDRVIVSSLMLACVPALVATGVRVEVATCAPCEAEAIGAYRLGAKAWWVKDWRMAL